jgi:hypothetical protein
MPRSFASGLHHFVGGENAGIPSIYVSIVLILQRLKLFIVTDLVDHLVLKFGRYFFAAIRGGAPRN